MAAFGLKVLLIAIVDQRVEVGDALDDDIAAAAAVAAVGSAELDEFLAAKAYRAGAAVAALEKDFGLIQEFHRISAACPPNEKGECGHSPFVFNLARRAGSGEGPTPQPPPGPVRPTQKSVRRGSCGSARRPRSTRTAYGRGPGRRCGRHGISCRAAAPGCCPARRSRRRRASIRGGDRVNRDRCAMSRRLSCAP